jgi:ferrous iron transport protein B
MTGHESSPARFAPDAPVVLVGNPNVGKSVIFGALTGRYVTVSNYPGTTVEVSRGMLPNQIPLIDTPGTNSLTATTDDERVTADLLYKQQEHIRAVIQVADAKNLQRALLLTVQLMELRIPMLLVLNMIDEANDHGVNIDVHKLSAVLGIEVLTTIATRNIGLDSLKDGLERAHLSHFPLHYAPPLEHAITRIEHLLPDHSTPRTLAIHLLAGEAAQGQPFALTADLSAIQADLSAHEKRPARAVVISEQMRVARYILQDVMHIQPARDTGRARLGAWMIHPFWGWPFLLVILWLVYKFVGEFGAGTLVKFLESTIFGQVISPAATRLVDTVLPAPIFHDLFVGQYGLITMALAYGLAIVLPIVFTFFLAFSILEDSGYLPRLAIMFNRLFKWMGLNGKAVLPMVLGLGCDTMATMSTRILETRKERILVTLLLALGVPCSAQLGVILGMLSQVGTVGTLIWGGVVFGTMVAVGLIASKLLPGEQSDFILEIPPIRWPRLDNIVIKTLARMEWYLKEVLPLFIVGTLLLFVLDKTGALVVAERIGAPLITGLLGLPPVATSAFLIGFLRRDYGAAGLFALSTAGVLDTRQTIVSLIVITLFIPCIANVLVIVKEYGGKVAAGMALTVFPLAFAIGGIVNVILVRAGM